MTFERSVNIQKFKVFLEALRAKYPFDSMLLVMDNLAIHRSNEVAERMNELGFRWTYTPRYQPWYNGIEEVWAISKAYIKQQRLNAVMNGREVDIIKLIYESFERMSILSISKCINRSLKLLNIN